MIKDIADENSFEPAGTKEELRTKLLEEIVKGEVALENGNSIRITSQDELDEFFRSL